MKVYIGPYRYRWTSAIHTTYMNRKYRASGWTDSSNTLEALLEILEDAIQRVYDCTINKILDKRPDQRVRVRIDPFDTWGMDSTLCHIILPMLKQLRDTKHGGPYTDDEDVPEELRSVNAPPKENEYDTDDFHFDRWDYIIGEMVWAFETMSDDSWDSEFIEFGPDHILGEPPVRWDREGMASVEARISNGTRLFGKYYRALWD